MSELEDCKTTKTTLKTTLDFFDMKVRTIDPSEMFNMCFNTYELVSGIPYSWYDCVKEMNATGIDAVPTLFDWYMKETHFDPSTCYMLACAPFVRELEEDGIAARKIKKYMQAKLDLLQKVPSK